MAELRPYPFSALLRRIFTEYDEKQAIFDLPAKKFVTGFGRDLSVEFHGHRAATPLGPAAGPQSQLAQNIVLSWLAGGRVMELKTVQVMDTLEIPRPCIDMQTIGFNVEWSQELRLQESLEEYVKGSMLLEIMSAAKLIDMPDGFERTIFDMSVGYNLEGIRSDTVQAFIKGMLDATEVVERLRKQIPPEFAQYRDLDFTTCLSDTLTLSTFHGCPPEEIEKIIEFLLEENRLHSIIKLNPMLLGPTEARRLLHDVMGYDDVHIPDTAFERDTRWDQAVGFVERLGARADSLGLGLGVKFSNTLIVNNERDFFPATEKEMYLSGPPLHVLAVNLVGQFREHFGDRYPISFSAGIDNKNFADAMAIGLVPITVCSDWLKPGGYGRGLSYFKELERRMDAVGAKNIDELILKAYGHAEATLAGLDPDGNIASALADGGDLRAAAGDDVFDTWVSRARVANTKTYVERCTTDPRYGKAKNNKLPKKIGSMLELFDCITCDKCIPVCPNDANFSFVLDPTEILVEKLEKTADGWTTHYGESIAIEQKHQIANFADFCNECGNCDIFCPEDGGPYVLKPRFFGSGADFDEFRSHDGFFIEKSGSTIRVRGRFDGAAFSLERTGERIAYAGEGFSVRFDRAAPGDTIEGDATVPVDLTYFQIMDRVQAALLSEINYVRFIAES